MKRLELKKTRHSFKVGSECQEIEPNITEDVLMVEDGEPVGFYIADLSKNYPKVAELADQELRSDRVPKQIMLRNTGGEQYSTIIGGVPPKPHLGRPYPKTSSVHDTKTARSFIKYMLLLALESEQIIKDLTPNIWEKQYEIFQKHVDRKWHFGNIFTSSISNYNIASAYHIDRANIKDCVNVIVSKRKHSEGGNTTVPDYGATFASNDGAMLVYPAWRNLHGVTPIRQLNPSGYRNTLVFYPLKGFYSEELK